MMNHYIIWFNLKENIKAHQFLQDLVNYLNLLRESKLIVDYKIMRRKLGFGPSELGEFMVDLLFKNLEQLDMAFHSVLKGMNENNELNILHKKVYCNVNDFRSSL
ncbi:MAG: hypothetical protein OEV44_04300 [Spirochaetota bacterium]|nr:hypothetical protein [Spirochaetota bacterium]